MTVDVSDKSLRGAARAIHKYLTDELGADEARLWSPRQNPQGDAWAVSWEGGPYRWAANVTAGESMFGIGSGDPEITGFYKNGDWLAEPYFTFDLQFHPQ